MHMAKKFTVVSITDKGDQLSSSGMTSYAQVTRDIAERLRAATVYIEFVIIGTTDAGRTNIQTLDRADAERYVATAPTA
jgi:hypothetical protein